MVEIKLKFKSMPARSPVFFRAKEGQNSNVKSIESFGHSFVYLFVDSYLPPAREVFIRRFGLC